MHMKNWTELETVPAAAITFAGGNENKYPIIFTTQHGQPLTGGNTQDWVIRSLEVSISRDWGVSTAMIVLTCNLKSAISEIPPLPDVSSYRQGNYPYLTVEDEIRIYAGYVLTPYTPIVPSMLDEVPFNYSLFSGDDTPKEIKHDINKPLAPIFWGFIDKIDFSGDSSAIQLIISCRDRSRVLSDTFIVSKASEIASQQSDLDEAALVENGDRISICRSVVNSINGFSPSGKDLDESKCWRPILPGKEFRGFTEVNGSYQRLKAVEDPASWIREASLKLTADGGNPRFHIWLERPNISKGWDKAVLQIINQSVYNVLDYFAATDERPMDLFCSHVNGDYVLGPRSLDISGFRDPDRNYRTYFFKSSPPDLDKPSPAQMILSIRAITTTLGTYNNFIISESGAKGNSGSFASSVRAGFQVMPSILKNRTVSPPCRTKIIYDPSIASAGSREEQEAAALITGIAASQIAARDLNGVQIEILGDPTFYPSEGIRVYNTLLHDRSISVIVKPELREEVFYSIKDRAAQAAAVDSNANPQERINNPLSSSSSLAAEVSENPARISTNKEENIIPVYKVRTIKHKLSTAGDRAFRTTITAVSDY